MTDHATVSIDTIDWRAVEARGCTSKRRYGEATARQIAADARAHGKSINAYPCPWCARWHLGHPLSVDGLETLAAALRARTIELGPAAHHHEDRP